MKYLLRMKKIFIKLADIIMKIPQHITMRTGPIVIDSKDQSNEILVDLTLFVNILLYGVRGIWS